MQAFFFYIAYPIIYLIASLPFWALYKLSDFFYLLFKISGYRRDVVVQNLKNSFRDKSEKEINALADAYYRYLCDLILETLKTLRTTEKEARERCTFHKQEWLTKLCEENRSIILVMGHYGNWEWAGPSFTLNTGYQLVVIYRPLSNKYFDNMMVGMRTKFGTRITPVNQTLRDMVASRKQLTATAFIADQSASHDNAHWMNFLGQDTAVFMGPEKLSTKFNYPVVYIKISRPKRGYYEVTPELLFENPKQTTDNEISEAFMNRLEKDIISDPTIWLWSHRRWKHQRPAKDE
ncbi:MAG: lysophospholipid acyltransferase family protein [Cyclobacteriaceae bacterium]|nr:lysophospholipid acyltransferase family protein [Cyclobacteriaceae bacterium]